MLGDPIPRPPSKKDKEGKLKPLMVFLFVWTYLLKDGNTPKARGTCNDGKCYAQAITMAHTYASCVEQSASRMFWSLAALSWITVVGADAGNVFAEADPSEDPLFMSIDDQYQKWWTQHLKKTPVQKGYILPVQHAIQVIWKRSLCLLLAGLFLVLLHGALCIFAIWQDWLSNRVCGYPISSYP